MHFTKLTFFALVAVSVSATPAPSVIDSSVVPVLGRDSVSVAPVPRDDCAGPCREKCTIGGYNYWECGIDGYVVRLAHHM